MKRNIDRTLQVCDLLVPITFDDADYIRETSFFEMLSCKRCPVMIDFEGRQMTVLSLDMA